MGCFLTNAKKNNLILENSSIVGKFGFSITKPILNSLIYSLYNYYMNSGYKRLCISHDGTDTATIIFLDIFIPAIKKLGITAHVAETPTILPQFVWFCKETNLKTLGLYIKTAASEGNIELQLFENRGPLTKQDFKNLIKTTDKVKISTLMGYEEEPQEFFNLEKYFKWLKDQKLINICPAVVNIDTMFGASCYLCRSFKKQPGLSINLFNLQTEPPRLKNYISTPTGQFLKWYTTYGTIRKDQFFFGLDNSGSNLGVYDLKQDIEISCAGVGILLLKYLKDIQKLDKAHIAVSKALNSKVIKYIKKLNYTYDLVSNGIYSVLNKNIKIDLYLDECGGYYFADDKILHTNPIIAMFRLIELATANKKSFGELLDEVSKEQKNITYHNNFYLISSFIPLETLIETLKILPNLKKHTKDKYFNTFQFLDKSKIVLKNNIKESIIEVFIEGLTGERCKDLGNFISKLIEEKVDKLD